MIRSHGALLCAITLLGAVACDEPASSTTAPTTTVETAAAAPSSDPEQPAQEPAQDIDLTLVREALKCSGKETDGPCGVVANYADCKSWTASTPGGDGRWMGYGYKVEGAAPPEQFVAMLRARRVPTEEVGPGQLPVRIGLAQLADDDKARKPADKAIKAMSRLDVPKGNLALEHIASLETWEEIFALPTKDGRVYGIARGGVFLCQGSKQQVLMIERAATRGSAGDGRYAELWPTTW